MFKNFQFVIILEIWNEQKMEFVFSVRDHRIIPVNDLNHLIINWSLFSIKDRKYVSRDAQQHLQAISKIIEKHLTGKSGNSGLVNATLKASYVLASVMRPYMDKYIQGIHFQIFSYMYLSVSRFNFDRWYILKPSSSLWLQCFAYALS